MVKGGAVPALEAAITNHDSPLVHAPARRALSLLSAGALSSWWQWSLALYNVALSLRAADPRDEVPSDAKEAADAK